MWYLGCHFHPTSLLRLSQLNFFSVYFRPCSSSVSDSSSFLWHYLSGVCCTQQAKPCPFQILVTVFIVTHSGVPVIPQYSQWSLGSVYYTMIFEIQFIPQINPYDRSYYKHKSYYLCSESQGHMRVRLYCSCTQPKCTEITDGYSSGIVEKVTILKLSQETIMIPLYPHSVFVSRSPTILYTGRDCGRKCCKQQRGGMQQTVFALKPLNWIFVQLKG